MVTVQGPEGYVDGSKPKLSKNELERCQKAEKKVVEQEEKEWWEGLEKGQWPLLNLIPDTSVPPCMPLVPSSCYPSAGAQRE